MATQQDLAIITVLSPYTIEKRSPPVPGLFCTICESTALYDIVERRALVYLEAEHEYTSIINFVCSEECFNMWLLRCQKN